MATFTIKKIPFSKIEKANVSLRDKDNSYSLKKHVTENDWDIAVNGALFSNGKKGVDPYYYWNLTDMIIGGVLNRGGNYSDKGIAFGNPWEGISAYWSTTANSKGKPVDFIGGGPTLLIDGKVNMDMKGLTTSFATALTQRTAIGIDKSNIYFLTTKGSKASLMSVAVALRDAGCLYAINLDGGGSTAFYDNGSYYTQGRNIPSAVGIKLKTYDGGSKNSDSTKKVFISAGHGGADPGAVANGLREKDINLSIALKVEDELKRHGVDVMMSRRVDENDPLLEEIKECNSFAPDLAISIHTNAGGGDGFEVYHSIFGGQSKVLAQNLNAEVLAIGQNSRGVKQRMNLYGKDYYGFIRETVAPAVIVEGAFIDNKTDIAIMDTVAEQEKFGVAYAKGILKTLGIAYINTIPTPVKPPVLADDNKYFRVQVGAFKNKYGADALAKELKSKGYSVLIKED